MFVNSPFSFDNLSISGRFVRSATEMFISHPDGHVNSLEYPIYNELAKQNFGIILTGNTCVMPEGRSQFTQNVLWSDGYIEEEAHIASIIKRSSAKAVLQLGHGGEKAHATNGGNETYSPDTMSVLQINKTVSAFAEAALRAKIAGFDGVQIHCAHFYLLSCFCYPQKNHRSDLYGGSAERRFRIVREIIEAVKKRCGDNFPVFLKINCDNAENGEDYFSDMCLFTQICRDCSAEAVELSGYDANPRGKADGPYFLHVLKKLKNYTDLPLMLVGGIRTGGDIEAAVTSGAATVSVCRPLICQPDFFNRVINGETAKCVNCNNCFSGNAFQNGSRCILSRQ